MELPPFPPPPTKLEKAVATTETRAVTLFGDGYEIHPENDRAGVYLVLTPLRTRGEQVYRHVYEVDLANGTCDCEMFQRAGTCKHLIACEKLVAKAVELAAPLLMGRSGAAGNAPLPAETEKRRSEPPRVLPVYGSEAWRRQKKDDFD